MHNTPLISFLVVHYSDTKALRHLVNELLTISKSQSFTCEIIIANHSQNPIQFTEENVKTTQSDNIGFGAGINKIAQQAQSETLFVCNPDIENISIDFHQLLSHLQKPRVGIVAPEVYTPEGKLEKWSGSTHTYTPWRILLNNILPYQTHKATHPEKMAWISGAAFAIKRDVFLEVEGFDEKFFLYFEDVDLCRRITKVGYDIYKDPRYRIVHTSGTSMSSHKEQKYHYDRSMDYYIAKHHNQTALKLIQLIRTLRR